ncbi:MAG: DNA mismatch repair endonuclease MutL, partial [Mariprofundaceae bacterium]|nr:DNA mismatch repair endonuclease MutL [Mariprofundaceae bacterium]
VLQPMPQDDARVTYAAKLDNAERVIDWTNEAAQVDRQVRCFSPRPGARCLLGGRWLKIIAGAAELGSSSLAPGSVADDALGVACGGGTLYRISHLQPEGKKAMAAADFLRGRPLRRGDAFAVERGAVDQRHIHVLPPAVANRIAAGEVVERPASIVKELVENSLDAGATRIRVRVEQAGKTLIEVDDDGCGMGDADAQLSLQRHATSKISDAADLHTIASHGFRGEALPSIASVSRFEMLTALSGANAGISLKVEDGGDAGAAPAAPRRGTRIRVRDLFCNTPARQRFLRTDRTEEGVMLEALRSLALANPGVGFSLLCDGRTRLDVAQGQSREARIAAILGKSFMGNQLAHSEAFEGIHVAGYFALPTHHHRDAGRMHFFINGRVIHDRQLISALKAGYRDVLFHDRFPQAVLWIEMDPAEVDVNVHPAKREVRFRQPQSVRGAVVNCVRAAISRMGSQVSDATTAQALRAMGGAVARSGGQRFDGKPFTGQGSMGRQSGSWLDQQSMRLLFSSPTASGPSASPEAHEGEAAYAGGAWGCGQDGALHLGQPLTQIHRCYIVAQSEDGIVLVDQHAAAERITYERLKRQLADGKLATQMLLTAADWHPDAASSVWLHEHDEGLTAFGFSVQARGEESFAVTAIPAMLAGESPIELVEELVESLRLAGSEAEGRGRVLERWLGNRACKGSIKAGRLLKIEEQEALLREMEQTPNIAQCNHGRPTYVRLSLLELDGLFGRRG